MVVAQQDEIGILTEQVDSLINNAILGYYPHRQVLTLMKYTGARISDALSCEHWELDSNTGISFYAQKNNTLVLLPQFELPTTIGEILNRARIAAGVLKYEDIARYIKSYQPYIISTSQTNNLRSHIFRYYFAKLKYSQGKTIQSISTMIGDTEQRTVGYIGATITIN